MRPQIKLFIFILVTGLFVFLWSKSVNIKETLTILKSCNIWLVLLATLLGFGTTFLGSLRQKILFGIIKKKISIRTLWSYGYLSGLSTIILPFFTGGFIFPYLVSKKIKITYKKALLITFIDFGIATGFSFAFGILGAFKWGISKPIVFVSYSLLVVIALIFIFKKYSLEVYLSVIKNTGFLKALLIGLIVYMFGVLQTYVYFVAFGLNPAFIDFTFAISVFSILNLIPGSPAKLGQYELFGVLVFGYLLGLDKNIVSAVFITQHTISLTLSVIVGLVMLRFTNEKLLPRVKGSQPINS